MFVWERREKFLSRNQFEAFRERKIIHPSDTEILFAIPFEGINGRMTKCLSPAWTVRGVIYCRLQIHSRLKVDPLQRHFPHQLIINNSKISNFSQQKKVFSKSQMFKYLVKYRPNFSPLLMLRHDFHLHSIASISIFLPWWTFTRWIFLLPPSLIYLFPALFFLLIADLKCKK